MRTIAHLSDLHFGSIDPTVCHALGDAVRAVRPDVVIVSGDMTQRARRAEFAQAEAFLKTLPAPQIVVPGNHDVPLYNLFQRAFRPLGRYRRYISASLEPFFADAEIAVAGINTARALTFKDGRINKDQLTRVARRFADQAEGITRIVVTHHPFEGPSEADDQGIVGRAGMAIRAFSKSRVDMILSGHLHLNRFSGSATRYVVEGYSALLIQAGTAISRRRREEANSFNVIRIERPHIRLECKAWDADKGFVTASIGTFRFGASGWAPIGSVVLPEFIDAAEPIAVQTPAS